MNDLLIILGFLGIAYYIYQDPKHLEIEKYKYQVAFILLIFFMYYVTVSNELFEGFPECSHKCTTELDETECKKKNTCEWNDNKCKAKDDKCPDIKDETKCNDNDSCQWLKEKKYCIQPKGDKEKCEKPDFYTCWFGNCDENDCLINATSELCDNKKEKTKCVADPKSCPGNCDLNSENTIIKKCEAISASNKCNADKNCQWVSNKCSIKDKATKEKACKDLKDKSKCSANNLCSYTTTCPKDGECEKKKTDKKPDECKDGCKTVPINYIINAGAECKGEECTADECCMDSNSLCPANITINKKDYNLLGSGNIREVGSCKNNYIYNCNNSSYYSIKKEDKPSCS